MKEVISARNKTSYYILSALCVFAVVQNTLFLRSPTLRPIAIPMYIVYFLAAIIFISFVLNPHGVIERDGDSIIIRRGIRKTIVSRKDILEVFPTPHPSKPNQIQKNAVSFKITVNGKEQILVCGDVVDVDTTVEKLTAIISET